MGRFSKNDLCYSFEILHGHLSNKIIRIGTLIVLDGKLTYLATAPVLVGVRSPCKTPTLQHKPFWEKWPILAFVRPKSAFQGCRGGPQNLFSLESYYFCELGAHAKKSKSYENPFWCKRQEGPHKNKMWKNIKNSGHLRLCQQPRASHALRSDQYIGPKSFFKEEMATMLPKTVPNYIKWEM